MFAPQAIKRLPGNTVFAAKLLNTDPSLGFFKNFDDLFRQKSFLFHKSIILFNVIPGRCQF
jgi:hypothetical protein